MSAAATQGGHNKYPTYYRMMG